MGVGVPFQGANKVYRAPPDREDISDLHVFANGNCIVSAWELTDAELQEIVRTRRVFLSSFSGDTLFPAFVGSETVVRGVVVDYGPVWAATKDPAHG